MSMPPLPVRDAVAARRAKRAISTAFISDEETHAMAEAMRLSPSCNNKQPWHVIAVRGAAALERLKGCLPRGNGWAKASPLILAVCSRAEDDCMLSDGRDYHLFDCGLAVGEMMLAATEMGIIAHPIAGYDPLMAKEALSVPEDFILITLVVCGRPGNDSSMLSEKQLLAEGERPARRPSGENLFADAWGAPLFPEVHSEHLSED